MKKFLIDIVWVILAGLVAWTAIEFVVMKKHNNYEYKHQYLEEHSIDIKTLLIGSSQFENSINPHLMGDSVFDAAIAQTWIYYNYLMLDKYIPKMKSLKTVIYPLPYLMPFSSYHNHGIGEYEKRNIYQYSAHFGLNYDRMPEKITGHSALCMGIVVEAKEKVACDSIGYEPVFGQEPSWQSNVDEPLDYSDPSFSSDTSEFTFYLAKIAELCSQHEVRFIVVAPPFPNCYIEKTIDPKGDSIRYEIVDRVRKKYPVEYKDYLRHPDFRDDNMYVNCSHLNSTGADKFAILVKNDFGL